MSTYQEIIAHFNIKKEAGDLKSTSPINGEVIAAIKQHRAENIDKIAQNAQTAFEKWRTTPAPIRGEFVRLLGEELRADKEMLGKLVTIECGKILSEGFGEVQEMIDICDFAVGLSRQLYGLTIASERPLHHMRETWHPLGPIGIISAFNFPVAVWSWNAALALVCGNSIIWKPSEKTPLTALACHHIFDRTVKKFRAAGHEIPDHLSQLFIGGKSVGEALSEHQSIPLISATGSVPMGRAVAKTVAGRLGRSLLELGGNNGMIVAPSADLSMATRAILFGAVGTAGQRCTSLRRLFVQEDIYETLKKSLLTAYDQIRIGNPLDKNTLVGPLIDEDAYNQMQETIKQAKAEGGAVLMGGERSIAQNYNNGFYVQPCIIEMPDQTKAVENETFAPVLYLMKYKNFEDVIKKHNDVPQGLSSSIFSNDMRETERFLSATGSDCGIANANLGTSGAEIGGAFGGEKETGGGRESGSDSWKIYMRRQTQTINYGSALPLAQGVEFDL